MLQTKKTRDAEMKLKPTGGNAGDHGRRREDMRGHGKPREATGGHERPQEATRGHGEATKGHVKLRLFKAKYIFKNIKR